MSEAEVPFRALLRLFAYGERGIIERPVLEELLEGVLHLNDELLTVFRLAIDIEDCLACRRPVPQMLAVQMHDVLNHLLAVEQAVQEVYQQVLVGCCSEYAFETEVGEQTNVSFFSGCHHIASLIVLLRQSYNENLKPPNLWQELSMEFQRIVPTNKHIPVLPCGDITSSKKSMST